MFMRVLAGALALAASTTGVAAQGRSDHGAHARSHAHHGHGHGHGHAERGRASAVKPATHTQVDHAPHSDDHGIETENLFGFVSGSDVEHVGARGVALETVLRSGKRSGDYLALGKKIEFSYGLTDSLSIAGALLGSYHRIEGVPEFEDVRALRFNGVGAEARWRLLRRETNGFGLTLQIEPVLARSDELSGLPGTKWGLENKIILDTALVPDRLFGAFNVIHEVERVKERGAPEVERASKIGVGFALATPLAKDVFIGAEARYMHAYEGLGFNSFEGRALFVGPTLHARINGGAWLSVAWNVQVAGRAKGDVSSLDLDNFERHAVRVKAGFEF